MLRPAASALIVVVMMPCPIDRHGLFGDVPHPALSEPPGATKTPCTRSTIVTPQAPASKAGASSGTVTTTSGGGPSDEGWPSSTPPSPLGPSVRPVASSATFGPSAVPPSPPPALYLT